MLKLTVLQQTKAIQSQSRWSAPLNQLSINRQEIAHQSLPSVMQITFGRKLILESDQAIFMTHSQNASWWTVRAVRVNCTKCNSVNWSKFTNNHTSTLSGPKNYVIIQLINMREVHREGLFSKLIWMFWICSCRLRMGLECGLLIIGNLLLC